MLEAQCCGGRYLTSLKLDDNDIVIAIFLPCSSLEIVHFVGLV